MKKLLFTFSTVFCFGFTYSQATNAENYIQTRIYLEPVTTISSTAKQTHTVQYFDGLGRLKQVVNVKASPLQKDVVTHIEYDAFGRETKSFLPVPQSNTSNGAIVSNPLGNATQINIYGSEKIYSEKTIENSPLDRILEQKQVGNAWSSKPIKFDYDANIHEDYVRKYETTTTWVEGRTQTSVQLLQYFLPNQLYKNTVTDEDGNKTIEFKNGKGQLLLVRRVLSATENTDTYYVFNEYDQLAFVIPPLASAPTVESSTMENLYYQYRYDNKSRLVEKKLPGKGWELMVYDKNDRVVLSQDAMLGSVNNNFNKKGWIFTKYDKFGRVVYTGFFANTATRASMQTALNNMSSGNVESRNTAPFILNGMDVYYTKTAFPTGSMTILSVNYYDTYPVLPPNITIPTSILGQTVITDNQNADVNTNNLSVASYIKNIENDGWTKSFTWYDDKGRAIGTHSVNHLGGSTKTESKLDFVGVVKQMLTRHKRLDSDTEKVITENFEYDHQNRLKAHKHQVDNNPVEYLTQNDYNELSQLENKKVGGTSAGDGLQSIDYKYNIRGWMTKLNDPSNLNGKLFGYEMRYNERIGEESPDPLDADLKVLPRFNGNIAEVDWRTGTNPNENLRRYGYVYDGLNRLKAGFYQNEVNPSATEYYEKLTYDLNGNIVNLKRTASKGGNTVAGLIDNLTYNYNYPLTGNRLNSITDASQNYEGYPGGGSTITYDLNGNMTKHLDKGIQKISYNFLNLPNYMGDETASLPKGSAFIYRADGTKLKKTYSFRKVGDFGTISYAQTQTEYLGGFQYVLEDGVLTCIGCPAPSPTLQFIPTSEGYFDFVKNKYIYNYADHLGNTRLSYFYNGSNIEVLEENNYYPFGLKHEGYNALAGNQSYQYKYNGKELQETGMYDYGARFYMPDIGKWGVIDPLAEKYRRWTPYNYVMNNPIRFIDPDGMRAGTDLARMINDWADSVNSANGNNPDGSKPQNRDWIPEIQGGHLVAKMEKGDTAETLAKFLSVDKEAADKLFSSMKNGVLNIPENIGQVKAINEAINDVIVNPNDYNDENYNCFLSAYNISSGQSFKEYENGFLLGRFDRLQPKDFVSYIKAGYEKAGNSDKIFGSTIVAFKGYNIIKSYGGLVTEKTLDLNHAAIYLGTSRNGTEYTFSKNGTRTPQIQTTTSLKNIYGHKVGYWNKSRN